MLISIDNIKLKFIKVIICSLEINLEKYKKIINKPLIIIRNKIIE